jgi:glycosyltransferase involved in cell wall biosynthesis
MLEEAGLPVMEDPQPAHLMDAIEGADLVLLHFWNTPEVDSLLRAAWPKCRLVIWCHVAGDTPPQLVTPELIAFSDLTLASSPYSQGLSAFRAADSERTGAVWPGVDQNRFATLRPRPHETFNIGYVGLVDDVKLHPRFVAMSAAAGIPNARFIVCGEGGARARLEREAREAGFSDRMEFRGWVRDVAAVLPEIDVLGHPLSPDSYASVECAVQEAMCAGIPPVVLAQPGALACLVRHGETGLLVRTEAEYSRALADLAANPEARLRLGKNARAWAVSHFDAAATASAFTEIFQRLTSEPKRSRVWAFGLVQDQIPGAHRFLSWLGPQAAPFLASLTATSSAIAADADDQIARSSAVLKSAGGGGILHYRAACPDDPYLRLWAGLVLDQGGRPALAAAEFYRARQLGLPASRVDDHFRRAAANAGAPERTSGFSA